MKTFKVYVAFSTRKYPDTHFVMKAMDAEGAKLEVQKMLRKRFGLNIYRDYRITRTLEQRGGPKKC